MSFRSRAAPLLQAGFPPGRAVVIDPTLPGQISLYPDGSVTADGPAGIGIDTTPAIRLRIAGPQKAGFTPGGFIIEEANAVRIEDSLDAPLVEFDVGNGFSHPVQFTVTADNKLAAVVGALGIPVGKACYVAGGGLNVTTDASSNFTITFPTPFPTACDDVLLTQQFAGTATAFAHVGAVTTATAVVHIRTANTTPPSDPGAGFNWIGYYLALGH